jgi:hypothetical protein
VNREQRIRKIRDLVSRANQGDRLARQELQDQLESLMALNESVRKIRRLRNLWIRKTFPNQPVVWRRVRRQLTAEARESVGERPDQLEQILSEWTALMDRRQQERERQLATMQVRTADRRLQAYHRQAIRAQRWLEVIQRYWRPTQRPTAAEVERIRNPSQWTMDDFSSYAKFMLGQAQADKPNEEE